MKYLKYTIILIGIFSVIGIGNAIAKTYFYVNVNIPALHGTWASGQKEKNEDYMVQYFSNSSARDSLGNNYVMAGRTYSYYNPVGYSSWKYASVNTSASWGDENKRINDYRLELKTKNYNALSVSFSGSWTLGE